MDRALVIALTGGIGSGKSRVAERFAELGVPVIDADILAREQVLPGTPGLKKIVSAFGPSMLTDSGRLDRARLRQRIFQDPSARKRLEAILHPRIRREMQRRVREANAPYVVLVIPLLLESNQTDLADRILVVDAPEALQLERVRRRDRQTTAQVHAALRSQCSRSERLAAADDVIVNDDTLEQLRRQTDELHQHYMSLTRNG
jgi:dephospho-CoA kinase